MGRSSVWFAALSAVAAAAAAPLAGQGSSVSSHSACSSARAGAAAAAPCEDASSIFYNPAGLALAPSAVSAGFSSIYNTGSFTYDSTGAVVERDPGMPTLPHAYASYRFGNRWAAGLGVFAPYGLGIEWPEDFEGRFISWKSSLEGIYLQPTLAWEAVPGRLGIGAGVDVVRGGIELNQNVDAPLQNIQLALLGIPLGTDIATARMRGSGWGLGGQVGVYWTPFSWLGFGARYMHGVRVDLEGDADFEAVATGLTVILPDETTGEPMPVPLDALVAESFGPGGPLEDQAVTAGLTLPPQAVFGARFGALSDASFTVDYQWTGWSSFDRIRAEFENGGSLVLPLNYEDTHTFRLGSDLAPFDDLDLRIGFIYNTAASPRTSVTPILPESERQLYTAGIGYRFGAFRADAFYNYVDAADRRGRVRSRLLVPTDPETLNVGLYASEAHLFGLTITFLPGGAR